MQARCGDASASELESMIVSSKFKKDLRIVWVMIATWLRIRAQPDLCAAQFGTSVAQSMPLHPTWQTHCRVSYWHAPLPEHASAFAEGQLSNGHCVGESPTDPTQRHRPVV